MQKNNKLILTSSVLLVAIGLLYFFQMPRQEDPKLKDRFGTLVYIYPGATAEQVERLVVRPIEDELSDVKQVKDVQVLSRSQSAIIELDLQDSVKDLNQAWIDIDEALEKAKGKFPAGVFLSQRMKGMELEAIVLAVHGSKSKIELLDFARKLKDELLNDPETAKVKLVGDPQEQLVIEISDQILADKGVSLGTLTQVIQSSNSSQAAGSVRIQSRQAEIVAPTNLNSIDQIQALRIPLPSGDSIRLGDLAQIYRGVKEPQAQEFRYQGEVAVGLGIIPRENINVVSYGEKIRRRLSQVPTQNFKVSEVAYQPARTEIRLQDLTWSLILGIISVIGLLTFWMGWRTSLIVGVSVPSITLIGLGVYGLIDGVLHQISIAAFVVSIGQFIDNIIVMVDRAQKQLVNGLSLEQSAEQTSQEFRRPMIFATGTGIAAFIPMLAAEGPTADFTSAFPIVAILTLIISYFFAIYVTPALMMLILKTEEKPRVLPGYEQIKNLFLRLALGPSWIVLTTSLCLLLISGVLFTMVKKQFFPAADRNEFIFTLELPEGSRFEATKRLTLEIEEILKANASVKEHSSNIGGGMPRFYYNLPVVFQSPHVSQVLVTTIDKAANHKVGQQLEDWINSNRPEALGYARYLEQGPPLVAPVELRVKSDQIEEKRKVIQRLKAELRKQAGTRAIRDTLGLGSPRYELEQFDGSSLQIGVDRTVLGSVLQKETQGLQVGTYRGGRDLVPLILRGPKSEMKSAETLQQLKLTSVRDQDFQLAQLAEINFTMAPAVLQRRNKQSYSSVLSDLQPGYTFNQVTQNLQSTVQQINQSGSVTVDFGGESEGSGEANLSILKVVPLAILILVVCLLAEFGSFRKILIVLLALPFVVIGIAPGLYFGQSAFGFMSLLGVLALMGIVVNNVILILESLSDHFDQGDSARDTISGAINDRLRPILLTTFLTLVGLLPLALQDSSLWPPLAWAMISGLLASTFSTLVVVPTLFRLLFFGQPGMKVRTQKVSALAGLLMGLMLVPIASRSQTQATFQSTFQSTLDELFSRAELVPEVEASRDQLEITRLKKSTLDRSLFLPSLKLEATTAQRNRDLETRTPFGLNKVENRTFQEGQLELQQVLFSAQGMIYERKALDQEVRSQDLLIRNQIFLNRVRLGHAIYDLQIMRSSLKALKATLQTLIEQRQEVNRQVSLGRLGSGDLARIDVEMSEVENQIFSLQQDELVLTEVFERFKIQLSEIPAISAPTARLQLKSPTPGEERADVLALAEQQLAFEARSQGFKSKFAPELSAYGRLISSNRADFAENNWNELGINLRWSIFNGGTDRTQALQAALAQQALDREKSEVRQKIKIELALQLKNLRSLNDKWSRNQKNQALLARTVALERTRFTKGRGSLQDLLANQALYKEIKLEAARLPFEIYKSCLNIDYLQGRQPRGQCIDLME